MYTITFNSNGGTTITDLTEQTTLPTPLPTPTKSGYTFVNWYYESNFQTRAKAGDTIEANTTLYAKWHTLGTLFAGIANAIRSKDGTSGNIRDLDFDDRIRAIEGAKEEQTKTVSPTTSSQDVLPDTNKVLSKVTVNAIPTETKSQQPNLSSGNQVINATSGKFMTSFTITKDTINHIASNIRSGKTLYGVTGNLQPAKEEETKTITPNFSSGNVVVTPTTNKVMTQVTINKDTTNHIADNIKDGVTLYGVTGTLASGGGTSVDRIGIICFELYLSKDSSTTQTLTYNISYEMLSKTFFTDGEGNWYLPEDVSVYYRNTYKGKANTELTLFSGTGTFSGFSVTFKVGTTPVALLLYRYFGDDDVLFTGFNSSGYLSIGWQTGSGVIIPSPAHTEFIELSGNFFDDFPFPHYSSSYVDYWKKENFFKFLFAGMRLEIGWSLEDPD